MSETRATTVRFTLPWTQTVGSWAVFLISFIFGWWLVSRLFYDDASSPGIGWTFVLGAAVGAALYGLSGLASATTVSSAGIESRSLLRRRRVRWTDVREVDAGRSRIGGRAVRVSLDDGASMLLPAPLRGYWPTIDGEFAGKLAVIQAMWGESQEQDPPVSS